MTLITLSITWPIGIAAAYQCHPLPTLIGPLAVVPLDGLDLCRDGFRR